LNVERETTADAALDRPEIVQALFYPRREWRDEQDMAGELVLISVAPEVVVSGRFHLLVPRGPALLFFHGNGEIAADYTDIALIFGQRGMNLLAVDYRGYGRSSGRPTVTSMLRDSHAIYAYTRQWLQERGAMGPLLVMGRSLGSASALELGTAYADELDGLIIDSGFAYSNTLLALVGMNLEKLGLTEERAFRNLAKIARFYKPVLIIHGEWDELLPLREAKDLFAACPSSVKRLLVVPRAGHNDILAIGLPAYLEALSWLCKQLQGLSPR